MSPTSTWRAAWEKQLCSLELWLSVYVERFSLRGRSRMGDPSAFLTNGAFLTTASRPGVVLAPRYASRPNCLR